MAETSQAELNQKAYSKIAPDGRRHTYVFRYDTLDTPTRIGLVEAIRMFTLREDLGTRLNGREVVVMSKDLGLYNTSLQ